MTMKLDSFQMDVAQFRVRMGLPIGMHPQLLDANATSFYSRFIMEELSEFLKAHEDQDLTSAADALGDLLYLITGMGLHMGMPLTELLETIHRANMNKRAGPSKRASHDVYKPAGWIGPEQSITKLLNDHMSTPPRALL